MALLLICLAVGACSRSADPEAERGDDAAWLSTEATREVGMHVLLNRYPQAQIVSESENGQTWSYRFATNGTVLPVAVVVDRKAGKARFEKMRR